MGLIDADNLEFCGIGVFDHDGEPMMRMEDVRESVDNAPTIDAVPVVRRKDCRWYEPVTDWGVDEATGRRDHSKIVRKDYGECHGQDFVFTEDGCLRVGENDFCSYGERKEGAT